MPTGAPFGMGMLKRKVSRPGVPLADPAGVGVPGALEEPSVSRDSIRLMQSIGGKLGAMISPGYNAENYGPLVADPFQLGKKRHPSATRAVGYQSGGMR